MEQFSLDKCARLRQEIENAQHMQVVANKALREELAIDVRNSGMIPGVLLQHSHTNQTLRIVEQRSPTMNYNKTQGYVLVEVLTKKGIRSRAVNPYRIIKTTALEYRNHYLQNQKGEKDET